MCSSNLVHFSQQLLCVQHRQISGTKKSKARDHGGGRNLSTEKRAQAVALANADYSQIHIGRVRGCCRSAKAKIVKRFREKDTPGRGRTVSQLLVRTASWLVSLVSDYN